MAAPQRVFVSRGGDKLDFALVQFGVDVAGLVCADLGSHVGGFVDCLLQRGLARVYSVDTAYGILAWKLRKDPRVVVLERTNAMHVTLPEPVDLVTIDVAWTPQKRILPAAARLLKPGGRVITLIKPHYEAPPELLVNGVLPDEHFDEVVKTVLDDIASDQRLDVHLSRDRKGGVLPRWTHVACAESPIRGQGGNREMLALLQGAWE